MDFTKLSGLGNDFILFDNRDNHFSGDERDFITEICQRGLSVGADGVILLEESAFADFKYRHFNADGSVAEMCGNGARSICYYAVQQKIAPTQLSFEVEGVLYRARVMGDQVRLEMPPPETLEFNPGIVSEPELKEGGFAKVGVPHFVVFVEDVNRIDVMTLGQKYRHHTYFSAGANVNFVQVLNKNTLRIRTYERGVENETLACGTGSTSAAIIAAQQFQMTTPITVKTNGGDLLLDWKPDYTPIYLQGPAKIVYEGRLFENNQVSH
ncbi:diaminopimelate epimerase [bacterium]|nr:diaminopimelate epimerase [bacterium]